MASRDKTNEASERLVRTTVDSYKTLTDYVVALQGWSVRFALGIFNDRGASPANREQPGRGADPGGAISEADGNLSETVPGVDRRLCGSSLRAFLLLSGESAVCGS